MCIRLLLVIGLVFTINNCTTQTEPLVTTKKSQFKSKSQEERSEYGEEGQEGEASAITDPITLAVWIQTTEEFGVHGQVFENQLAQSLEKSPNINLLHSALLVDKKIDKKKASKKGYNVVGNYKIQKIKSNGGVIWIDAMCSFNISYGGAKRKVSFTVMERCNGQDNDSLYQKCARFLGNKAENEIWSKLANLAR